MKPTLALLTALLLALLAAHAQQTTATVRDHLWMFGVPPGSDQGYFEGGSSLCVGQPEAHARLTVVATLCDGGGECTLIDAEPGRGNVHE